MEEEYKMKIQLKYVLLLTLAFFTLLNIAYSQEKADFTTFKDKDAGFSISYPNTWIQIDPDTNINNRFIAAKDYDYPYFLVLTVTVIEYTDKSKTTNDYVTYALKNPELLTRGRIEPTIISSQRVKWASHDAAFVQLESTNRASGLRTTTLNYATVVDGVYYGIALGCHTKYFPEYKSIMEKVAATFSTFPIEPKTANENQSKVRSPSDILNDEATSLPQPQYPAAAKAVRAAGEVRVQIKIDKNGRVISASAISGHPLLRTAAETAAKKASFNANDGISSGILVYSFPPK